MKYDFDPKKVTSLVNKEHNAHSFRTAHAHFSSIGGQNLHVSASCKISCKTRHKSHAPVQGHGRLS